MLTVGSNLHVFDLNISDLKLDPDNPNKLNKKQKKALRGVIDKYGFLVPIVVDKDMNVIDGEHRAEAYKMLGYELIPGVICDKTKEDYDRKFLRQWLNKFHGTPDPELDINELEYIYREEAGAAMLGEYLGIEREDIDKMLAELDKAEALEGLDDDEKADVKRKIILYFTKFEFKEYEQKFNKLKEDYAVTTETEVVKRLIEHYESTI